jgi:GTP cyclohydrolase I
MQVNAIANLIENFAPLELQENWDCSGFGIEVDKDVKKILLCLSVTQKMINQALQKNCDMIIAHHPMFFVPFEFCKQIPIYSAHTNLDKTNGGTTDTLIELLDMAAEVDFQSDFLRIVKFEDKISLDDLIAFVKSRLNLKTLRVVNNLKQHQVQTIAFCAGSGADLLPDVQKIRADVFVTGDVKYHSALESDVIIIDVGHFESEVPVLVKLKSILENVGLEVVIADEKSPFINY